MTNKLQTETSPFFIVKPYLVNGPYWNSWTWISGSWGDFYQKKSIDVARKRETLQTLHHLNPILQEIGEISEWLGRNDPKFPAFLSKIAVGVQ